jgi:hypothetical protein
MAAKQAVSLQEVAIDMPGAHPKWLSSSMPAAMPSLPQRPAVAG